MKISLIRQKPSSSIEEINHHIINVFSSIPNLSIKEIDVPRSQEFNNGGYPPSSVKVIVTCEAPPGISGDNNFIGLINEAVSSSGDLHLEAIAFDNILSESSSHPKNNIDEINRLLWNMSFSGEAPSQKTNLFPPRFEIVKIPAITSIGPNLFEVQDRFAIFIAHNQEYLKNILNKNVINIFLKFEKVNEKLRYTGEMEMEHSLSEETVVNPKNAYHCFAYAIFTDMNLRNKLASNAIQTVRFQIMANGQILTSIALTEHYKVTMPQTKHMAPIIGNRLTLDEPFRNFGLNFK